MLKLVEAGRLALDSPANNYLGQARITGTDAERATLRHVLTHTAGLPAYFRMRFADDAQTFENTIASRAILTRPSGRRYLYSNLGYGILDHIIERVAGVTYADFMHRELFEPLQLGQTSVPTAPPLGAAVGTAPTTRRSPSTTSIIEAHPRCTRVRMIWSGSECFT